MQLLEILNFIQQGGETLRFHTVRTARTQNVGHHSFGVVWLLWLLTEGKASSRLLMAGAAHDLPEQIVGDIPAPVKRRIGKAWDTLHKMEDEILEKYGMKFELSQEERAYLKTADRMEGMLFCCQERALGNLRIESVFNNFSEYARTSIEGLEKIDTTGRAKLLYNEIHQLWAIGGRCG